MDLSGYFEPIDSAIVDFHSEPFRPMLGDEIRAYTADAGFPDLEGAQLALLGVKEDRGSVDNRGCAEGPDHVRHYLYRLARPDEETTVVDLGNIAAGATLRDKFESCAKTTLGLRDSEIAAIRRNLSAASF